MLEKNASRRKSKKDIDDNSVVKKNKESDFSDECENVKNN